MPPVLRKVTHRSEYAVPKGEPYFEDPSLVCQLEWGWLIPRVHRVLASPKTVVAFAKWKRTSSVSGFPERAYWEAAHYLVHMLLGWREPAQGLLQLVETGETHNDPRLELLKRVWNHEGQLELLQAWYGGGYRRDGGFTGLTRTTASVGLPEDWWAKFRVKWGPTSDVGAFGPEVNGNSLHLGYSLAGATEAPVEPRDGKDSFLETCAPKRAVLVLQEMKSWYAKLEAAGESLPEPAEFSWHVEVYVQPLGFLGTFRKSKVTGLWFQGTHTVHMLGNRGS